jgi:hypothetical protein
VDITKIECVSSSPKLKFKQNNEKTKVARSRFELLSPGFFSLYRDPEPEIPSPTSIPWRLATRFGILFLILNNKIRPGFVTCMHACMNERVNERMHTPLMQPFVQGLTSIYINACTHTTHGLQWKLTKNCYLILPLRINLSHYKTIL